MFWLEVELVGRIVPVFDRDEAGVCVGRVGGLHLVGAGFGGEVDVGAAGAPGVGGLSRPPA